MVNKKGRRWAIVTLDDKSARVDARFFPDDFERFEEILQADKVLVVSGSVMFDEFRGGLTITVREVMDIVGAREKHLRRIRIGMEKNWCTPANIGNLKGLIQEYGSGTCPISIHYRQDEAEVFLDVGAMWYLVPEDQLLHELKQMLGPEQVQLVFH